jgi:serine/threonine-protein kinase
VQLTTDKPVAVKLLKQSQPSDAARFVREAKVAAGLSHRNIVQVFDYWEVENGPVFLVMELLVGESLTDLCERRGALSIGETLAVVVPIANALRAAHALKIVHRDLKPDNVFLTRAGSDGGEVEVKVLDFGLAKQATVDAQATAVTQTGSVMGTPFYMSPEQVYGERDIDVRSDVWSLGVIVFECLAGRKPFTGDNFGQVFRSITQTTPPRLREVVPTAPEQLEALVFRMLAHDRAGRPDIGEVCDAFTSIAAAAVDATAPHQAQATLRLDPSSVGLPKARPEGAPMMSLAHPPRDATMLAAATSVQTSPPSATRQRVIVGAVVLVAIAVGAAVALRPGPTARGKAPELVTLPPLPAATIDVPSTSASAAPTLEPPAPATTAVTPPMPAQKAASKNDDPVRHPPTARPASTAKRPPSVAGSASNTAGDPLGRGRF